MSLETQLATIKQQETELALDHFDENIALEIGLAIVAKAQGRGQSILVNVSKGLHTIFQFSMPGTSGANEDFALRKRAVTNLMQFSSIVFMLHKQNGFDYLAHMGGNPREFGAHGGAFPLTVKGAGAIGSIVVSGLADDADHNLIVEVLNEMLGRNAPLLEV